MITRAELGDTAFLLAVFEDGVDLEVHDLRALRDLSEFRQGILSI